MNSKISGNIRKIRELRDLTREHVADELGMTVSGYSRLERGEVDITIVRLFRLSQLFNIEMVELIAFDTSNSVSRKDAHLPPAVIESHTICYREKYIQMLEMELERLKDQIEDSKERVPDALRTIK